MLPSLRRVSSQGVWEKTHPQLRLSENNPTMHSPLLDIKTDVLCQPTNPSVWSETCDKKIQFRPLHVLIPDKLAFVIADRSEASKLFPCNAEVDSVLFVTTDLHWQYSPFAADFGPVNLAIVYRFCALLAKRLDHESRLLVYCIEPQTESIANASFLLGSYLVLKRGMNPFAASRHFEHSTYPYLLIPFRDATHLPQDYDLTLLDCLCGLAKAVEAGWFSLNEFKLQLYELLESPENGDIHQISPKFVAFKGPLELESERRLEGEIALPAVHYARVLRRMGVTCVVRLNEPDTYNKAEFEEHGIRHYDLYFDDCTVPPESRVENFLRICHRERKLAIHCRAGLGRTGTLIGTWMMNHAGFGANECIAWLRIVRPGSVIGPQQHYLKSREAATAPCKEVGAPGMSLSSAELARQVTYSMRDREAKMLASSGFHMSLDSDDDDDDGTDDDVSLPTEHISAGLNCAAAAAADEETVGASKGCWAEQDGEAGMWHSSGLLRRVSCPSAVELANLTHPPRPPCPLCPPVGLNVTALPPSPCAARWGRRASAESASLLYRRRQRRSSALLLRAIASAS